MFILIRLIFKKLSLLKFTYVGFLLCSNFFVAQQFRLKRDSDFIKNFQIEINANGKNSLFLSSKGFVNILIEEFQHAENIVIVDLDHHTTYRLYSEELKVKDSLLYFTTGRLIEEVVIHAIKREKIELGIPHKGATTKLYTMPDIISVIEIPKNILKEGKRIVKLRFNFVGGRHPAYKFKIAKQNTTILPVLYTCESVDCKNPKKLIPDMEVNYIEGEKYLEVDLNHKNIVIDENFQNIYLGYISLGYDVVRQKKKDKVGDIKCYRGSTRHQDYREVVRKCSIMSLIVQ